MLKNNLLFLFVFCATFINAQKKINKSVSFVNIKETYWTSKLNKKDNVIGIKISLTTGFNKSADISIYLNKKLIRNCENCKTNESIGFVKDKNSSEIYFNFFLNFKKVKIGDKIKIKYDNEMAEYNITSEMFKYTKLNISRKNSLNWVFSFVNEVGVKYIE